MFVNVINTNIHYFIKIWNYDSQLPSWCNFLDISSTCIDLAVASSIAIDYF